MVPAHHDRENIDEGKSNLYIIIYPCNPLIWYIYLDFIDVYGKFRSTYHTWMLWGKQIYKMKYLEQITGVEKTGPHIFICICFTVS